MTDTIKGSGSLGADDLWDYSWGAFAASGDSGFPINIPAHVRDIAFQVTGSVGTSGAVSLEGSNDGTNYSILKDIAGTAVTATDATIWRVANFPKFVKPVATAGSGASLTAYLHGRVIG